MQFNHFLVRDEEPLLFHACLKGMFPALCEAVAKIIDPAKLHLSFLNRSPGGCSRRG
jgi:flavorubredoxin